MEAINQWKPGMPLPIFFNLANTTDMTKIFLSIDAELKTNLYGNIKGRINLYIDGFNEGLGIELNKEKLIL